MLSLLLLMTALRTTLKSGTPPQEQAFTDRYDLRLRFQKTKTLKTSRDDVMSRSGRRWVAEMMRHEEAPVVHRFLLLSRRSRTFVA